MKWGKTIPIINHDSYVSIENMNFWMDLKKQETFEHLAAIRQPVLVLGPRGSGKTTAVQTIVKRKMGNNKPFVAVNCNALNNSLADSELFGYVKGAYTGADKGKKGLVEEANGGCLFLDEVQDLSPETQGKLLKCIEEHTFQKVGSTKILNSNFFLICSSNRSLEELHSLLLEDFYDRISVFQIEMESIEDLKKEDGFLESVLPSIWDNYHKKTKNVFFLDYEKTKQNYPLLMEKLLSVLKENNLLGNFRDIEKLVAYLDLHIYNFNAAVDVNRNWKSAIEEWEKYIVERNRIVQEKNNVNKKEDSLDKFSIKNSDDDLESLIEYLKWDGMNKLFRKWLAQWSTEKYGSFNAAARALKKDKNVISRALNEDL
ncbi:MAG: sigma 54-interacting transcriptional regulator [Spirochaetales bacterium]|nr:sigma 54-interacting transcriptional regulator [Spirochaetales bacterium]